MPTSAANYTFDILATTAQGDYASLGQHPAIDASGQVVFTGQLTPTGDPRLFRHDGTTRTTLAVLNPAVEETLFFRRQPVANASGQVVFFDTRAAGTGLYLTDGTTTTPIATPADPFAISEGNGSLNTAGTVVFAGTINGRPGVYTGSGGPLTTIAEVHPVTTDPTQGKFPEGTQFVGVPAINDGDHVVWVVWNPLAEVHELWRFVPGTGYTLLYQHPLVGEFPSLNSAGDVLFQVGERVGVQPGQHQAIVQLTASTAAFQVRAETSPLFPFFWHFRQNWGLPFTDTGQLAFTGQPSALGHGLFTGPNPLVERVLEEGDVDFPHLGDDGPIRLGRASGNTAGQLVFWVFVDQPTPQSLIVRATPTAEALADPDHDGVATAQDACPGTAWPEQPTQQLGVSRYMLTDFNRRFDTVLPARGPKPPRFTLKDTHGCSCTQIVEALGLGLRHLRQGCSLQVMQQWVAAP